MIASRPIPMVLDTDPGMGQPGADLDDGLALMMTLTSPELDLLGVTTVNGNVDQPTGTDVARRLLRRLGRTDLEVYAGASEPLVQDMAPLRALFEAASPPAAARPDPASRLGPTSPEPAWEFLSRVAAERPGEVAVVAIGPMTNLAIAITSDPSFAANVGEFVLMAGSATTYAQNITPVGDFNTYVDPEALDVVLRSGAPIRMVGIDQTSLTRLTRADAARIRQLGTADSSWLADCVEAWIGYLSVAFPTREEHRSACFLADPLVIAALISPGIFRWEDAHVQVPLKDALVRGLAIADRGLALAPAARPNASVAVSTDVGAFHELFMSRIVRAVAGGPVKH
jgi:inosine-uridine nucleoside N-ribohydrolase